MIWLASKNRSAIRYPRVSAEPDQSAMSRDRQSAGSEAVDARTAAAGERLAR